MTWGLYPRVWFVCSILFVGALFSLPAVAQDEAPDVVGTWMGTLKTPTENVEMTISIKRVDGQLQGAIQGNGQERALTRLTVQGNRLNFSYKPDQAPSELIYAGLLDEGFTFVEGKLSADFLPIDLDLNFTKVDDGSGTMTDASGVKKYRPGSGPAGSWVGRVETVDGEQIEVRLQLDQGDGAGWVGMISGPIMGDVQAENIRVSDTFISFRFQPREVPFPANFAGSYIAADDRITATLSQRGTSRFVKFRREPGTVILTTIGPDGKPREPAPLRHNYKFALTGRVAWWIAVKYITDDQRNLNNITTNTVGYDLTLKWFPIDGANFFVRAFQGGLGYDTKEELLAPFEDIGLTKDSYMKLDGFELGVMGYLGNSIMRNSKFNPYLTGAVGHCNWAVMESGRDTPAVGDRIEPVQGNSWCFAFGMGTEYKLSEKFLIEFEWLWRYITSEDEERFPDTETYWTNTHAWNLSLGLSWGFF